ncbi:MAG TPA: PEPxxWA-CTERM sorting domain-containing protein [Qipengyuania sp.]|nr:PEPxxWA-CTERM sorting domain-containing protein [Qipengyuania sp.]
MPSHIRSTAGGIGIANIRGITTAVPEPSTWLTMILGFGAIGTAFRRRGERVPSLRTC